MAKKKFNAHPFPYHHELVMEIHTLTNLGVGLGRVEVSSGGKQEASSGKRPGGSDQADPLDPAIGSTSQPSTLNSQLAGASASSELQAPASTPPATVADGPGPNSQLSTLNSQLPKGWVVMVPFTLPGETVRVRIYRNHKNYSEADLLEVLTPSPHRLAAPCPLFGRCGGCQYQHLAYAEQLKWKRQQVEELLKFMAGVAFAVSPVIGSPREFGYRSKITPHFAQPRFPAVAESADPGGMAAAQKPELATAAAAQPIGFLKQGSRFELVDVPQCPIATPEINTKLTEVRAQVRARLARGEYERGATLLLRHAQEGVVTDYDAVIHEVVAQGSDKREAESGKPEAAGSFTQLSTLNPQLGVAPPLRLHFLARDFFQNNPFILPAFTRYVREQAAASGARFLVDAYCGSGLFALSCAPVFERVAGVELSASSVRFATENAAANGIANATFRAGDAAQIFAGLEFPPADTAVVIDPPRRGCDESFLQQLFAFGPRAVVYVSCDPATQMRDLKGFLAAGYALTAVQPFDLFPQTRHLECVITLRRAG